MADPTTYTPDYSFTDYQVNLPSRPLPAPELDIELANISEALGGVVDAVKDIRRSDGALKNGIVTRESLALGLTTGTVDGAALDAALRAEAAAALMGPTIESFRVGAMTDTQTLQAAVNWLAANGGTVRGAYGDSYTITATITGSPVGTLDLTGVSIEIAAAIPGLRFIRPPIGPFLLTSNYDAGGLALVVASTGTAASEGQRILVRSEALNPRDRDQGSSLDKFRCGEQCFAAAGSTTTNIVLKKPIEYPTGISPTTTAGDEARVNAYYTAYAPKVYLCDDSETFNLIGGDVFYTAGQGLTWKQQAIELAGYANGKITTKVSRSYGPGIKITGCHAMVGEDNEISNLSDDTGNGRYGYAFATSGSLDCQFRGIKATNVRHGFTSSNPGQDANETDWLRILSQGNDTGHKVINGLCTDGNSGGWDGHHDSVRLTFVNCVADGLGIAFGGRGRQIVHDRPVARRCISGCLTGVDYQGGNPDDDLWLNGTLAEDVTTAFVYAPDIECIATPIGTTGGYLNVFGPGRYISQDHRIFNNQGAQLTIAGEHTAVVLAGGTGYTGGCVHVTANTSKYLASMGPSRIVIEAGSIVSIDAYSSGSGPLLGLSAAADTSIVVRGILRLRLPAGSSLLSATGSIYCEGDGAIEFAIAADTGHIPTNMTGRALRIRRITGETVYDSMPKGVTVEAAQIVAYSGGGLTVQGDNVALRIRDTDDSVSDGENVGGIDFITNDTSSPELVAAAIRAVGRGSSGGANLVTQIQGTTMMTITEATTRLVVPTFADNAAALAGGLIATALYKTATGEVRIVV